MYLGKDFFFLEWNRASNYTGEGHSQSTRTRCTPSTRISKKRVVMSSPLPIFANESATKFASQTTCNTCTCQSRSSSLQTFLTTATEQTREFLLFTTWTACKQSLSNNTFLCPLFQANVNRSNLHNKGILILPYLPANHSKQHVPLNPFMHRSCRTRKSDNNQSDNSLERKARCCIASNNRSHIPLATRSLGGREWCFQAAPHTQHSRYCRRALYEIVQFCKRSSPAIPTIRKTVLSEIRHFSRPFSTANSQH